MQIYMNSKVTMNVNVNLNFIGVIVIFRLLCISLAQNGKTASNEENISKQEVQQNAVVLLTPEDFVGSQSEEFERQLFGSGPNNSAENYSALNPNKFEGDISIPGNRSIHSFVNDSNSVNRAAVRDQWRKWPNNEIPYVVSDQYGSYSKQVLARAFDEYQKRTCIRFVPRDDAKHVDYIYIYPEDGCYSYVGRTNGRQTVSLDAGCMQFGTVLHELMHAVGFFHEQSRADRDDYVKIVWSNVRSDADTQFEKYSLRTITQLDLPYDYSSVMHYGPRTFSKNGRDTVVPLKAGCDTGASMMGQRRGFSYLDLKKLNKLYDCGDQYAVGPNDGVDSGQLTNGGGGSSSSTNQNWAIGGASVNAAVCENKKWTCFFWKLLGYCWRDKPWMLQYCPYSCDYCDEINSGDPDNRNSVDSGVKRFSTSNTPDESSSSSSSSQFSLRTNGIINNNGTSTNAKNCTDLHSHCRAWSKLGYCSSTRKDFRAFMNQQCPKTCGRCSGNDDISKDSSGHSHNDISNDSSGHSHNDISVASEKSKASFFGINDISDVSSSTTISSPICRDKLTVCRMYAFGDFCKAGNNKRGFMLENCKQSCNFC